MNNRTPYILAAAVLIVVIGGLAFFLGRGQKSSVNTANSTPIANNNASPSATSTSGAKTYSLADVAAHNTAADCWMVISGKVYDVTKFIGQHPGGAEILKGCGTDATALFNARPTKSNTPHSATARALLPDYYIGDLK